MKKIKVSYIKLCFFYLACLSLTLTINLGGGEAIGVFYSSPSLPPTHKHSDISCQFFNLDGYLVFLFSAHIITRQLLSEIYPPLGISIWDALHDLVLFVQLKKRENTHVGVLTFRKVAGDVDYFAVQNLRINFIPS